MIEKVKADLHIHTTASDGSKSVSQVFEWAKEKSLNLISITDHDNCDSIAEAIELGEKMNIKVIPGLEISTVTGTEIHILGYNIDFLSDEFQMDMQEILLYRQNRNILLGERLAELDIVLDMDFSAKGIGRKNVADEMVKSGYCNSVSDAFKMYLSKTGKAYIECKRATPIEAITLIKRHGGVSVLAHPRKYLQEGKLEMLVEGLVRFGLDGIEAHYYSHTEKETNIFINLAKKHRLIVTGGTDYHGDVDKSLEYYPDMMTLNALKIE